MPLSTVPYAIVVEDDPIIMMETSYILEDAGFRVHESFDGDEAILHLADHWESTVLLFSDVDMPGTINGFALARHVAEHWPQIEIVIASGHMAPEKGDIRAQQRRNAVIGRNRPGYSFAHVQLNR
ncbi:response regulator [Sphingomonas sp. Leaf412]|uniref:response regulator n=1 Tax=Sphingomonas sp. Leaf412 TaxID=1736370 RepID=UPI0009EADF58|nr:response regulator [Sphingomonas sp. Leaf412]